MSKVVKSVGRAVKGVVKGVSKVVRGVVKGVSGVVKKIAGSSLGRVLLAAATIYFGGAAIMGAIGGAGAGSGFLGTIGGAIKGAGAGIANAWSGLTGAAGAAMSGNFGAAGSSLSQGFMGANAAGAGSVGGMQAVGMNLPAGVQASGAVTTPVTNSLTPLTQATTPAAAGGAGSGFWGTNAGTATVLAGGQIAGGLIQGAGQQKALEEQRNFEQAEIDRRNREMAEGRFMFSDAGDSNFTPTQGGGGMPMYGTPNTAGGPALVRTGGMIASRMSDPNFQYNFPTFNPAMSRFYG
jgi:hypothetical protein